MADQSRHQYPAFRAWLLVAGMVFAAGIAVAKAFDHVVMTLLRDRHEAAGRELESERAELRDRYGTRERWQRWD